MSQQNDQIWSMLIRAGVVDGPAPEAGEIDSPWYVKMLLAFSPWLAALLVIGFVWTNLDFVFTSVAGSLITGGAMIVYAYAILRWTKHEFASNFTLAVSFAGQALVAQAIFFNMALEEEMAWALPALLQVPVVVVVENFVYRVMSSSIVALAFCMALTSLGTPYAVSSLIKPLLSCLWLNEFRYPRHMRKIQAIGYGPVLGLIPLKGTASLSFDFLGLQSA